MASGTLDLAAWRRIKAVRQGVAGSFATLWNEYVGQIWSVVRPVCKREGDALGWCASFRLALEEALPRFDPVAPLGPQIGARLFDHLSPAFQDNLPVPSEVLPPTPAGLALLPPSVRLAWLIELFFDVTEEVFSSEPGMLPRLRGARRSLEPVTATDLRMELRQTLALAAPESVMMLPPGQETPPRRAWWGLWIPALLVLLVVAVGTPMAAQHRWDRKSAAVIHQEVVGHPEGFLLESSPEALSARLSSAGLATVLTEVPALEETGMHLVGAQIRAEDGPAVVMEYRLGEQHWTLQHHLRPDPTGLEPFTGPWKDGDVAMEAVTENGTRLVSWRDTEGLWILGSAAAPVDLLARAALIRQVIDTERPKKTAN